MLKNLDILNEAVGNKSTIIKNDVKLLNDFYNKADPITQQFIDTLLYFHKAIPNKTIKEVSVSISIGKIVSNQSFISILQSIILNPLVVVTNYQRKEPVLMIKYVNDTIVGFNLADIKVVLYNTEKVNGKTYYFIQLHSDHNKIDYSMIITEKEISNDD